MATYVAGSRGGTQKYETEMNKGAEKAEQLTGATSEEIGKGRGRVRGLYEDILNQPSRGAARVAQSRNADLKRLRQSQSTSGVSGPMADLQKAQVSQNYASQIGDTRQKEYLDALNKLEKQYRGASGDVLSTMGQYGAISQGAAPTPSLGSGGGLTYLCTELRKRGLIGKWELFFIHILLVVGTVFKPAHTLFYLLQGSRLINSMNRNEVNWKGVRLSLFAPCLNLLKKGRLLKAINLYELETRKLFLRYGFVREVALFEDSWSFSKLVKSYKVMWRLRHV
jgi:hypothetical protein